MAMGTGPRGWRPVKILEVWVGQGLHSRTFVVLLWPSLLAPRLLAGLGDLHAPYPRPAGRREPQAWPQGAGWSGPAHTWVW